MADYSKAYTEVLEIMTYLPEEEQSKIPMERIEFYFENRDENYDFHYNENIPFNEQQILPETQAIIITLFRDYYATDEQKEKLEKILNHNDLIRQEKINEVFNYESFFKQDEKSNNGVKKDVDVESNKNQEIESIDTQASLFVVRDNIFTKLIKRIKKLFKGNNRNE